MSAHPTKRRGCLAAVVAVIILFPAMAHAQTGKIVSRDGVNVWASGADFTAEPEWFDASRWETLEDGQLPRDLDGAPVVGDRSVVCVGNADPALWTIYTRDGDRLIRRGTLRAESVSRPSRHTVVANPSRGGLGVEVRDGGGQLQYALRVSRGGLVWFEPGSVNRIRFSETRLAYVIVPSLIGADLVYDARRYADDRRVFVPSLNLLAGLFDGGDGMMTAVWPPGAQLIELERAEGGGGRWFGGFSVNLASESFYLAFAEHSDIWRAEPLRASYLERDTAIGWRRPFEAEWIGRFYVESEDVCYPFYFQREKRKVWGRFIRGWYEYPLWFEGDASYVHFEKKFPPSEELLIYFLQNHAGDHQVASPVAVMRQALGSKTADELLDVEGVAMRPLLAHGDAVCAMTYKMRDIFGAGQEVTQKARIEQLANDVADFIEMIRDRVHEYADFARQMDELLQERGRVYSAPTRETLTAIVEDISLAATEDLPDVSLAEVREWANRIKRLAAEVRETNNKEYEALARQCRSVAGAQDDLARELSLMAIQLMERSAALGVNSPEQVRSTEMIISRSRQVLRRPTWWEPCRRVTLKSDPGIP